jgi:hypothetical protein
MPATGSHHVLRRALIGGYRVSDVEVALASLNLALSQLQLELEATRRRLVVAEGRIAGEEARLERARRVELDAAETVLTLQRQHENEARVARERIAAAEAELARQREAADARRQIPERRIDPPRATPPAQEVFGPAIELDAGPFGDLASLTRFEQSLHALPGVSEVYIRGFAAGRATIDLALHAPSPLLQEMTDRLPYRLDVGSTDRGHISVTVRPEALSA